MVEDNILGEIKSRVQEIPVCIILPPSPFLSNERVFPALGPLKVAAELRQNGNPLEVLDLAGFENYQKIVEAYLESSPTKTIGITATTPQLPDVAKIRSIIKEINPDATIILGGPHATLTYSSKATDQQTGRHGRGTSAFCELEELFDKLVIGDGEMAIFQALDPRNPNKIVNAGDPNSPYFIKRGELDNFAFPARDLIDLDSYNYFIDGQRAFSVISQLGCPFKCGFCGGRNSPSFRIIRRRSVENITDEIEETITRSSQGTYPLSAVMFYDDELNITSEGVEKLCQGLLDLQEKIGLEMRFRGFVKAELFTKHQAEWMHKAGFRTILSGIESGSTRMLETIGKQTKPDINTKCLKTAQDAGIKFKALMSIGHPGESETTVNESMTWVMRARPDDIDWTIITQYPGSPYYDYSVFVPEINAWVYCEPKTKELLFSQEVKNTETPQFFKGVQGKYESYVWTKYLDRGQLVQLRDTAESMTRQELRLPPIQEISARQFEHSMGQSLPANILRKSAHF